MARGSGAALEHDAWRVSWFDDSTHELYAIELDEVPSFPLPSGALPARGDARTTGRVWLLGVLDDEAQVSRVIGELELHAQRERNSLVVVAQAISAASNPRVRTLRASSAD